MALVFVSDRSVNGAGFSARFQAVDLASHCDRTFTAASGRFTFDSSQFEQADSCDYRIQVSFIKYKGANANPTQRFRPTAAFCSPSRTSRLPASSALC
jgi:hypothetical protein